MNLREGTRRVALFLGAIGAIVGGFASYAELQTLLTQRAAHARFEQLANSEVVQQARKTLQEQVQYPDFIPDTGTNGQAASTSPKIDYDAIAKKHGGVPVQTDTQSGSVPPWALWGTAINNGGIKTIYWTDGLGVSSIETADGETLSPTPAPSPWPYLLVTLFPLLGFFIPWGAIRMIGWVGAGFVQPSK